LTLASATLLNARAVSRSRCWPVFQHCQRRERRRMVYRISVDTGGTFTDVVVAAADGSLTIGKAMTTPHRPFQVLFLRLQRSHPH
jgi:hypothetical protein